MRRVLNTKLNKYQQKVLQALYGDVIGTTLAEALHELPHAILYPDMTFQDLQDEYNQIGLNETICCENGYFKTSLGTLQLE